MAGLKVARKKFGLLSNGQKVHLFCLTNGSMTVCASDYGCTLTSIELPKKEGGVVDVLLGFSTLEGFVHDAACFGSLVGRFANRIGGASFMLEGVRFALDKNDGANTLHGGFDRWEKKIWSAELVRTEYGRGVRFFRTSPAGEQGFPGTVRVSVTYTLNECNELTLEYMATTDAVTPVNLTNHAYFNLKGYDGGSIMDQELMLWSDEYLEVDASLIPTGRRIPVAGTSFDFVRPRIIGFHEAGGGDGYDHCFCVRDFVRNGQLREAAVLKDSRSGRKMVVKTTAPGVQLYTGNFLRDVAGKNGFVYQNHAGLCLETEEFPDALNHADFPSVLLEPHDVYHQVTQYCFDF